MKVFISHGHNESAKLKIKEFIKDRLGHNPVILGEQPGRQGLTIIEALEEFGTKCEFAIILLTGDDITEDGGKRARQNVVHESGYFQGRLGRNKVVLVVERGVEVPSNLVGLFYLEYIHDVKELFEYLRSILASGDASTSANKLEESTLTTFVEKMGSMDQAWIRSIAKEIEPYIELPPATFFSVVTPILKKHGEGYARQAEQFRNQATQQDTDKPDAINAMIGFAGVMLIGPSERLAHLCQNAVSIMETPSIQPEDQIRAKKTVLKMFGLSPIAS